MALEQAMTSPSIRKRGWVILSVLAILSIIFITLTYGCSKPKPASDTAAAEVSPPPPPAETCNKSGLCQLQFDPEEPGETPVQSLLHAEQKFQDEHQDLRVLSVAPYLNYVLIYTEPCGCKPPRR
jgi:hypothetical protein